MTIAAVVPEEKKGKFDEYEIKDAMHALMKAEEVKANPKLLALVMKEVQKKKKAITSIEQIRAESNGEISDSSEENEEVDEVEKDS